MLLIVLHLFCLPMVNAMALQLLWHGHGRPWNCSNPSCPLGDAGRSRHMFEGLGSMQHVLKCLVAACRAMVNLHARPAFSTSSETQNCKLCNYTEPTW